MRAARTPPEPPPITNRSTSSAIAALSVVLVFARRPNFSGDRLAALLHLLAELAVHFVTESLAPVLHVLQAGVDRLRLLGLHLLADGRLVEREHVLEFLLGESCGVDARHLISHLR